MGLKGAPFLFALGVTGCATPEVPAPPGTPATNRPNLVVVLVDDLRFDEFHAGGHPYLDTPNIDRLAREGALFVNTFHAGRYQDRVFPRREAPADVAADLERHNVARDSAMAGVRSRMREELGRLVVEALGLKVP